jgi:hypothetical protein
VDAYSIFLLMPPARFSKTGRRLTELELFLRRALAYTASAKGAKFLDVLGSGPLGIRLRFLDVAAGL